MPSLPDEAHRVRLPLPPPTLPPRQLKKVETACKKWVMRFLLTLASAGGGDAADIADTAAAVCPAVSDTTGFAVLNGGVLAGCTPHNLRTALLDGGLVPCPAATSPAPTVLEYGSTLPFALCSHKLPAEVPVRDGACFSQLLVSMAELRRYAAQARASGESTAAASRATDSCTASASPAESALSAEAAVAVVMLQLPPSASLWRGGSATGSSDAASASSSASRGSGFLFLAPCCVSAVQAMVGRLFQKPVVGIESLLAATPLVAAAAAAPGESPVEGGPRTCAARAVPDIPGLFLVEDFVTAAEAAAIWEELRGHRAELQLEYLSRRRVAHFNRRFLYGSNTLTREGEAVNPRPSFYAWMRARLLNDDAAVRITGAYPFRPGDDACDQLTVNYYDYSEMGACGIATHVDAHSAFDDAVFIVSLGSYTVMDFARWDRQAEVAAPTGVFLAPRSLAVMTGEARYGWTHCIAEKRTDTVSELLPTLTRGDRLSLTWRRGRTQRHAKAGCPFPALCDGK